MIRFIGAETTALYLLAPSCIIGKEEEIRMYRLEEEKETVEGETVTVYGIAWETGRIRNITVDRERMRAFVMECERCGVSPEYLPEAVDAFLG